MNCRINLQLTASKLLDALALCLSQNAVYAGSLDKIISYKPSSVGYLPAISELNAVTQFSRIRKPALCEASKTQIFDTRLQSVTEKLDKGYELPHMPPWFNHNGSQNLYRPLAGTLRLVCLSTLAGYFRIQPLFSLITSSFLPEFFKLTADFSWWFMIRLRK